MQSFGLKIILALMFSLVCYSQDLSGKVIKIYDGDTITIMAKEKIKVRLFGIDAPELKQEFGKESREHLEELCPLNKEAKIKVVSKDRYKRAVGIVYCNGIEVNANQVESGYAWAYRDYSKKYIPLELNARSKKIGLWSKKAIEPRVYRDYGRKFDYNEWAKISW